MKKQWFQNGKRIIQNGKRILCDECPCGCPPFEGRSIVYVDKHATGTGDGSSWENAYTDIQTAINTHSRKEIQIKGYGENDCYHPNITLQDCVYLKGIGDVWLDGAGTWNGINGIYCSNNLIDNINIKNCAYIGIQGVEKVKNSTIKNFTGGTYYEMRGAFNQCGTLENCHSISNYTYGFLNCEAVSACSSYRDSDGFRRVKLIDDCTAEDCWVGFTPANGSTCSNSTAKNNRHDGFNGYHSGITYINCKSYNNADWGFNSNGNITTKNYYLDCESYGNYLGFCELNSVLTNCVSHDNTHCGFFPGNDLYPNTYIGCSEYNNCTSGYNRCDPNDEDYECDEV